MRLGRRQTGKLGEGRAFREGPSAPGALRGRAHRCREKGPRAGERRPGRRCLSDSFNRSLPPRGLCNNQSHGCDLTRTNCSHRSRHELLLSRTEGIFWLSVTSHSESCFQRGNFPTHRLWAMTSKGALPCSTLHRTCAFHCTHVVWSVFAETVVWPLLVDFSAQRLGDPVVALVL